MNKTSRDLTLEFHSLMSNRMDKTEHIGMKTQASTWIIAITIFYIATQDAPCRHYEHVSDFFFLFQVDTPLTNSLQSD